MPVSSDIYGQIGRGVRPIEDPQNALMRAMQVQGARDQRAQAQRAMEDENALREATIESGGDQNKLMQLLYGRGNYKAASGVQKNIQDADVARVGIEKDRAEIAAKKAAAAKTNSEVVADALKRYRAQLDYIESPQTAARWTQSQYEDPTIGPIMLQFGPLEEAIAQIPQDPQTFAQWREKQSKGMEQYRASIEQKPTSVNAGGAMKFLDMNPRSPTYKQEISSTTVTESEAQRLAREQRAAQAAADLAEQKRRTNLGDTRAREKLDIDRGAAVADAGGPGQVELTKKFGKAPKDHRWKADGSAEPIPGGPADLKAGELGAKAAAKRDAQISQAESVLETIRDAKGLVGYSTAGAGGYLSGVAATPARNLQGKLETVKANLGFDRLQQMRDNSPTGGALGAVAVQELTALQSTVASLDQLQSPDQLRKALDKIDGHYSRWLKVMKQAGNTGGADASFDDKPAGAMSPEDAQARDWAKKNLNDPRAKQIMQRLGG